MSTFIRDLNVQAHAVLTGVESAILAAPKANVLVDGDKHVRQLKDLRRDAQRMLELTGKEGSLEQEYHEREHAAALADARKLALVPPPRDADVLEAERAQDGVSWTPRHPEGGRFDAEVTQTIPRQFDRVIVDGQPYIAGRAEHDSMSCVLPLLFVPGHTYPPVVPNEETP